MSNLRSSLRLSLPALAAACLLLLAPLSASASPDTIRRSVGNISQAPLDLALSPLVAWATLNRNITEIDDTPGVRIAYYVPGLVWLMGLQVGASVLREVTGLIELLPGVFLIPFEADLDPLYDPVERGEALVEFENPVVDIKFGINYQSPAY
jgi:hypothetical protein